MNNLARSRKRIISFKTASIFGAALIIWVGAFFYYLTKVWKQILYSLIFSLL